MIDKRALTRRRLGLKQQSDQRNQNVSVVPGCHDTPSQGRHLRRPPPGAPSSCRRPCDRLRQLRLLNFRLRSRQLHAAQSSCFTSHLPRRCRFFPVRCRPCFPVFPETSLSRILPRITGPPPPPPLGPPRHLTHRNVRSFTNHDPPPLSSPLLFTL